jgi:hypothetical protein
MFKNLPRGVRQPGDGFVATGNGKVRDEGVEGDVRAFTA